MGIKTIFQNLTSLYRCWYWISLSTIISVILVAMYGTTRF